mgnify:CR=1 FL=1
MKETTAIAIATATETVAKKAAKEEKNNALGVEALRHELLGKVKEVRDESLESMRQQATTHKDAAEQVKKLRENLKKLQEDQFAGIDKRLDEQNQQTAAVVSDTASKLERLKAIIQEDAKVKREAAIEKSEANVNQVKREQSTMMKKELAQFNTSMKLEMTATEQKLKSNLEQQLNDVKKEVNLQNERLIEKIEMNTKLKTEVKETVQNARQDTDRLRQQMQISHETLDKSFNDLVVHIEGSVDEKMENMHRFITQLLQEGNTPQQHKMKSYKHNNDITRNSRDNDRKINDDEKRHSVCMMHNCNSYRICSNNSNSMKKVYK